MSAFLLRFQEQIGDPHSAAVGAVAVENATQTATKIAQETSDRDETAKRFCALSDSPPITGPPLGGHLPIDDSGATKTITEVKGEAADRSQQPLNVVLIPAL
jgi:hypothetical protein